MADPALYCLRCWLEQTRRNPMPPCRRCGGIGFESTLDIDKRNAVLTAAWPHGITAADRKFLSEHKLTPDDPEPKKKERSR